MQAKAAIDDHRDLYDFWGRKIYDSVRDEDGVIVNLDRLGYVYREDLSSDLEYVFERK